MQVDNQQGWKDWQEDGDPKVVAFAQRWAELMEARIAQGATVSEIANETMLQANTDKLSVDGLYQASQILTYVWEHGSALQAWKVER
jgi:hypothetical protein